jgi:hypothetical protein
MESLQATPQSQSVPQPRASTFDATCTQCGRLHRAQPLEFNPVCAVCAAERATLRSLGMRGAYPLSDEAITAEVKHTSPGNYALGYLEDGRFVVFYVGRSDRDLRSRLRDWVGTPSRYDRYAPSGLAAWGTRRGRGATPIASPALGRVGSDGQSSYTHFAYSYAVSSEIALQREHRNYEDFGGSAHLDNPRSPGGEVRHTADPEHRA